MISKIKFRVGFVMGQNCSCDTVNWPQKIFRGRGDQKNLKAGDQKILRQGIKKLEGQGTKKTKAGDQKN